MASCDPQAGTPDGTPDDTPRTPYETADAACWTARGLQWVDQQLGDLPRGASRQALDAVMDRLRADPLGSRIPVTAWQRLCQDIRIVQRDGRWGSGYYAANLAWERALTSIGALSDEERAALLVAQCRTPDHGIPPYVNRDTRARLAPALLSATKTGHLSTGDWLHLLQAHDPANTLGLAWANALTGDRPWIYSPEGRARVVSYVRAPEMDAPGTRLQPVQHRILSHWMFCEATGRATDVYAMYQLLRESRPDGDETDAPWSMLDLLLLPWRTGERPPTGADLEAFVARGGLSEIGDDRNTASLQDHTRLECVKRLVTHPPLAQQALRVCWALLRTSGQRFRVLGLLEVFRAAGPAWTDTDWQGDVLSLLGNHELPSSTEVTVGRRWVDWIEACQDVGAIDTWARAVIQVGTRMGSADWVRDRIAGYIASGVGGRTWHPAPETLSLLLTHGNGDLRWLGQQIAGNGVEAPARVRPR